MSWQDAFRDGFQDPASLLAGIETSEEELDGCRVGRAELRFRARDFRGEAYVAKARLLLPHELLEEPGQPVPVWFSCGYELAEVHAVRQVQRGRLVVTPCDPAEDEVFPMANPLCRGPNTDYVLAHLIRGHTWIDPTKIVYAGGSAGGYAALLVAAEAFPAAAAVPNAPPVNLGYQAAHLMANAPRIAAEPPTDEPLMGVLMSMFLPFIEQGWGRGYGTDIASPAYWEHSPVAHVERTTCPVTAVFSTGDFLVPIEQVGAQLAATTLANLPPGVVMAANELSSEPSAHVRLLEVLGDAVDVHVVPVPEGAAVASIRDIDLTMTRPQTPVPVPASPDQQWQVVVVDEGPTVFGVGHTRHLIEPDFEPFVTRVLSQAIGVEQLTAAKLEQLLARWSGREWLAPGFHHLDEASAERADVERGLRSYCRLSPGHARRFAELYAALPPSERVLPDPLVAQLNETAGPV
jgi:hypothetical protein